MRFWKNKKYNVLIIGSDGMFGHDLTSYLKYKASEKNSCINVVTETTKKDFNVSDKSSVYSFFNFSIHYDYIINCSAITDTKGIETNPDIYNKSYLVNYIGVSNLAKKCNSMNSKLIHISTDYVFSEHSVELNNRISQDDYGFCSLDQEFPINSYGLHKLLGEKEIKNILDRRKYLILRTSWLYGNHNHKSFVHKILKNAYNNSKIQCVNDEFSCPTSTETLCRYVYTGIQNDIHGIQHCIDKDKDFPKKVSRYDFAVEILKSYNEICKSRNLDIINSEIEPISSINHGQMRYPKLSLLETYSNNIKFQKINSNWKHQLQMFLIYNFNDIRNWLISK